MIQKGRKMLPLEEIRVLDLGRSPLSASYCTMLLADMGADVIKVEEPRRMKLAFVPDSEAMKISEEKRKDTVATYNFVDRNKRSICLNLKSREGQEIFHKLVRTSDVVVEAFRPGVAKRLGIDYETLKSVNPSIISCSITGYGQDGPYSNLPGHDPNFIGVAGVLGMTGTADGHHVIPSVPFSQFAGGMQGAIAILCAIVARVKKGRGQFIDVSATDCMVSLTILRHGQLYFSVNEQIEMGKRPAHVYETKDGKYVCLSPAEPLLWNKLCKSIGLEEYIPYREDALFSTDVGKGAEIVDRLKEVFRKKTRAEWFELLSQAMVSPVYGHMSEVLSDPQVLHRRMIIDVEHPTLGKVKQPGIPVKLSDISVDVRSLPPYRGQHTSDILLELGYSSDDISRLKEYYQE